MHQSNTSTTRVQAEGQPSVDVSVIIVSWNVEHLLTDCLRAIFSPEVSDDLRIEVTVVDNASTDNSAVVASSFASVKVIGSETNMGYGRANNLGMSTALGRYLLVLNPDTVPQADALKLLIDFADRHSRAGIVAPRLLNPDSSVQASAFHFPTLLMSVIDLFPLPGIVPGRIRQWLAGSALNGRYPKESMDAPFRMDHPLGACMLLRREAYEQVGGFDPNLFMYSEEIDLAMRYKQRGWERWQLPAARVIHLGGQSTAQAPSSMMLELWRSRIYLYSKYKPAPQRMLLRLLLIVAQITRLGATAVALVAGRNTPSQARRQLRHAVALLRLACGRTM